MIRFRGKGRRKILTRMSLLRAIVSLFAVSQLLPAGTSFAQEGEGFALVICTPEGVKTVSWEEATGEPSPFEAPSEDDHSGKSPCHACSTGGCSGGAAKAVRASYPNVPAAPPAPVGADVIPVFIRTNTGPPLPSRSPPAFS